MVTGSSKIWVGVDNTPVELKKSDSDDIVKGDLTVGGGVVFDDKSWIVCHVDNSNGCAYLAYPNIATLSKYNTSRQIPYADSILADTAMSFQNSMSDDALSRMVEVTVSEVTAKIFVPSDLLQYEYFYSMSGTALNGVRLCWFNGTYVRWWLSSSSVNSNIAFVTEDGYISTTTAAYNEYGFRPFCCITI